MNAKGQAAPSKPITQQQNKQEGAMKDRPKITQQDIQRALRKFEQQGRLVRKLPQQVAIRSRLVGARYGAFENPADSDAA